jgi:CBS domain-containing protein
MELIMTSYQADYPVFDLSGRYVGVLTRARLVKALREQSPDVRLVEVMIPADQVPTVGLSATLADVWERMGQSGSHVVSVTEGSEYLGFFNSDDITEIVHVYGAALERNPNHPPSSASPATSDASPAQLERL